MPEKPLTMATYAAGASLAAITLVYVFAPTFFIDGENGNSSASTRKKGVVGLSNQANDCFINSVLQAMAGLGDLRIYLIRETHRRTLDGAKIYSADATSGTNKGSLAPWKLEGLQRGLVTAGLKDVLDALNERPIYRKTISAQSFVTCLEDAFRQRISRQQQDAQEFLQVVAERLCDEYHAGHRARRIARKAESEQASQLEDIQEGAASGSEEPVIASGSTAPAQQAMSETIGKSSLGYAEEFEDRDAEHHLQSSDLQDPGEEGFPFEGTSESQIECLTCGFKPKPSESTFCTLTLNVPQVGSTTLNACIDGMFKTEYIEDFKCEKCRLVHAVETLREGLPNATSPNMRRAAESAIEKLQIAIDTDPEQPPLGVELPDSKLAPKRKIARHQRITKFPKVMAIHLSRSIFGGDRASMKNSAKVQFPERLPLGGLLNQERYKLLGAVTHKGNHNSGHYEAFRRQNMYAPFSTPNALDGSGVYSKNTTPAATPAATAVSSPRISTASRFEDGNGVIPTPELTSSSASTSSGSSPQSSESASATQTSTEKDKDKDTSSIRSVARSARASLNKVPSLASIKGASSKESGMAVPPRETDGGRFRRRKKLSDRWWRISDDKIKESKTAELLGMQREVYLLFYELERD